MSLMTASHELSTELTAHTTIRPIFVYLGNHIPEVFNEPDEAVAHVVLGILRINRQLAERWHIVRNEPAREFIPDSRNAIIAVAIYYLRHGKDVVIRTFNGASQVAEVTVREPRDGAHHINTGILFRHQDPDNKERASYYSNLHDFKDGEQYEVINLSQT